MSVWLYGVGMVVTFVHWCREADRDYPNLPHYTYEWFMGFMTVAWPVYWAGKLAWAPVQLLLPPPGDVP